MTLAAPLNGPEAELARDCEQMFNALQAIAQQAAAAAKVASDTHPGVASAFENIADLAAGAITMYLAEPPGS